MGWAVGESSSWGIGEYTGVINQAPVVTPPAALDIEFANGAAGLLKTNAVLVAWGQSAVATDAEDGSLAVSADFTPLPSTIAAGTYQIAFRSAPDSEGLTGVAYATLNVSEAVAVNGPPTVSGNYPQLTLIVGQPIFFDASANFSDPGDTLAYSFAEQHDGIDIDQSTGVITGSIEEEGGLTLTIVATDSVDQTATAQLPVVVIPQALAHYLVLKEFELLPDGALYVGNDLLVRVRLEDNLGNPVLAGDVSLFLRDTQKIPVPGGSFPITLSHEGLGVWFAVIDAAVQLQYGASYLVEISAKSGQLDGFWKKAYKAAHREFS